MVLNDISLFMTGPCSKLKPYHRSSSSLSRNLLLNFQYGVHMALKKIAEKEHEHNEPNTYNESNKLYIKTETLLKTNLHEFLILNNQNCVKCQ